MFLDNECLIRVYQSFDLIFQKSFLLCLMLSVTYCAQNHAGIISWSLAIAIFHYIQLFYYGLTPHYSSFSKFVTYYSQLQYGSGLIQTGSDTVFVYSY